MKGVAVLFAGYGGNPPDKKPGDANSQGFYSVWYVLDAHGKMIR